MNDELCEVCANEGRETHISEGIYRYSMNTFKKALCIHHQKEEREKTYPAKLAKFLNKNL